MRYLQDPLRDKQQDQPAAYCHECGGEVYHGERLYRWEGSFICEDCFRAEIISMLDSHPEQLASELNLEVNSIEGP